MTTGSLAGTTAAKYVGMTPPRSLLATLMNLSSLKDHLGKNPSTLLLKSTDFMAKLPLKPQSAGPPLS